MAKICITFDTLRGLGFMHPDPYVLHNTPHFTPPIDKSCCMFAIFPTRRRKSFFGLPPQAPRVPQTALVVKPPSHSRHSHVNGSGVDSSQEKQSTSRVRGAQPRAAAPAKGKRDPARKSRSHTNIHIAMVWARALRAADDRDGGWPPNHDASGYSPRLETKLAAFSTRAKALALGAESC